MARTLLLADDSVTIQRVIELTFADEDIRVIAVGDGQQAIDRIKADPPDIVLADTGMPERDGYDVATFIKADPSLAHIPVVLLTGAFEPVDGDRARQAGCDAVLVKPFEPQAVINRVRELLGGRPVGAQPHARAPAEAPTVRAEPARDPGETIGPPERDAAAPAAAAPPPAANASDDPLADYLDKMDEAFEQLEPPQSGDPPGRPAVSDPPGPAERASETDVDSLEGALSALEGVLDSWALGAETDDAADETSPAAAAPAGAPPVDDSPPSVEPVPAVHAAPVQAPVSPPVSAPKPAADVVIAPTSLTETPRQAAVPAPAPPAPLAVSVPEPARPAAPPPIRTAPPSLADAFASLLAAEQGDADRAGTVYPWPRPAAPAGVSEELIEQVTERVIARLSTGVTNELVTQVVARVAEKLVREQIDRITEV